MSEDEILPYRSPENPIPSPIRRRAATNLTFTGYVFTILGVLVVGEALYLLISLDRGGPGRYMVAGGLYLAVAGIVNLYGVRHVKMLSKSWEVALFFLNLFFMALFAVLIANVTYNLIKRRGHNGTLILLTFVTLLAFSAMSVASLIKVRRESRL